MAPTPYSAEGRMIFSITVSGLLHELSYPCEPAEDVTMPLGWALDGNDFGATNIDPQDAADAWWAIVKGLYPGTVNAPGWTLEKAFGGVFVPEAAGTAAGGAGSGGSAVLTSVTTLSFKDQQNLHVKFTVPECAVTLPYRSLLASDATVFGDFAADVLLLDVAAPSIGGWVRSRANNRVLASRFASATISKRLRRVRNFL